MLHGPVSGATRSWLLASSAAIGNGLQGWDNAAMAGSLLFIVPEFHLENSPGELGAIIAAGLMGSVLSTALSGPSTDFLGRRNSLLLASLVFAAGCIVDCCATNVHDLIFGRSFVGFSIGAISTISPLYISECAPADIRGQLATLPQLMGIGFMILSYAVTFMLSMTASPKWRLILGLGTAPAIVYIFLLTCFIPETPRWLVSKGKMKEAKNVLQLLRGCDDVSGELAMLVEGLGRPQDVRIEEWVLKPVPQDPEDVMYEDTCKDSSVIKLVGPAAACQWVAQPVEEVAAADHDDEALESSEEKSEENASGALRISSITVGESPNIDTVVSFMESLQQVSNNNHDLQENNCTPIFFGITDKDMTETGDLKDFETDYAGIAKNDLRTPLLAQSFMLQDEEAGNSLPPCPASLSSSRQPSIVSSLVTNSAVPLSSYGSRDIRGSLPESLAASSIGSGWQIAWQVAPVTDGGHVSGSTDSGSLRCVYLLQEPADLQSLESALCLPGASAASEQEAFQAAVVSCRSTLSNDDFQPQEAVGPAMLHPSEIPVLDATWLAFFEPGVKHALFVGLSLQILQQACGINAVMYFTPTILMESGAAILEAFGLSPQSSSILASGLTTSFMFPCIFLAMHLMDRAGRRQLLLTTIPAMSFSLLLLSFTSFFMSGTMKSISSILGVTLFSCSFVAGFGPIPNILCSEIFPTRVRGLCIGLCASSMWVSNICVSQSFPWLRGHLGLGGVFGCFGIMSFFSWCFIYTYVPETKGLPLEVIADIFAAAK